MARPPGKPDHCLIIAVVLFGNLALWGAVLTVAVWAVWPR